MTTNAHDFPRVLLIDHTRIGDGTATGEIKSNLFANWPADRLLQLYSLGETTFCLYQPSQTPQARQLIKYGHLWRLASAFNPEVIIYRPVPDTEHFHALAMDFIESSTTPLVLWVMDDWPSAHANSTAPHIRRLKSDWNKLLDRSARRLAISKPMSEAFRNRYQKEFLTFANGVTPQQWPAATPKTNLKTFKVRYAGSLAENMTLSSILLVAKAVEELGTQGHKISFEIKTRALWKRKAKRHFGAFKHTSIFARDLTPEDYRLWLSKSDATIIAYNFDTPSKAYTRYSLANKLPECLACGAPLLAIGPHDTATLSILHENDCGVRINDPDTSKIAEALRRLIESPEKRFALAEKAQRFAFEHMNSQNIRSAFEAAISNARDNNKVTAISFPRNIEASVDESLVIADLMKDRHGEDHIMIDVGAHFGASASPFQKLGWKIHCFEPDPQNREALERLLGKYSNVTIDPRAVADVPQSDTPFYQSHESSGISSLQPFQDSHKETARVDITTLADAISNNQYSRVDFLKIDVEGLDFSVLKGVPWQTLKPEVIECEFEDKKIPNAAHRWTDVAAFLTNKGYTVYISEWHPIIKYGISHDWRRLLRYPATDIPSEAWGNLLAFLTDPGETALRQAFEKNITYRTESAAPLALNSSGQQAGRLAQLPVRARYHALKKFKQIKTTLRALKNA